jgi:hypothetical protein
VSWGEVFDKIAILTLKVQRLRSGNSVISRAADDSRAAAHNAAASAHFLEAERAAASAAWSNERSRLEEERSAAAAAAAAERARLEEALSSRERMRSCAGGFICFL